MSARALVHYKQSGFGLSELMIALAITSVGAIISLTFFSNVVNVYLTGQYETNYIQLSETILRGISNVQTCSTTIGVDPQMATLLGSAPPTVFLDQTKAASKNGMPLTIYLPSSQACTNPTNCAATSLGNTALYPNQGVGLISADLTAGTTTAIPTYGMIVTQMAITSVAPVQVGRTNVPNLYTLILQATYTPIAAGVLGARAPQMIASFTVQTDAVGNIKSCVSSEAATDLSFFCANQNPSLFFVGATNAGQSFNGYPIDSNGCISPHAFEGKNLSGPIPGPGPGPGPKPTSPSPSSPPKSDARVKEVIKPYQYGLSEVLKIEPIWYRYNGRANTRAGELHAGVIAQRLLAIAPELVEHSFEKLDPQDAQASEVLGVRYADFQMMLVRALQEQQQQIDKMRNELRALSKPK